LAIVCAAAAAELPVLTPAHSKILAEVNSRWWGWQSEPAPIVPTPKSWELLEEQWSISAETEVVILTATEPSPPEAYIAEMLRREPSGRHHIPCRAVTDLEAVSTSDFVICVATSIIDAVTIDDSTISSTGNCASAEASMLPIGAAGRVEALGFVHL
jgi:hypothetical protein